MSRVLNIRVPEDWARRAKAVAAWKGLSFKAYVIECVAQAIEREWGGMFEAREPRPVERLESFSPPEITVRRGGQGQLRGWKCSNNSCTWEKSLPPGPMVPSVRQMFVKDAKESFERHVEDCPVLRERHVKAS